MSLNFPANPTNGDTYTSGSITYVYQDPPGKWTASTQVNLDSRYVNASGDTMTGNLTVPSLNLGALGGTRNAIINGGMAINQRGAASYSTALSYSADRWKVGAATTVDYAAGGAPEAPTGNHLSVQGTNPWVGQAIETGNAGVPFLVGNTYTVSYWVGQDTALSPGAAVGWAENGDGVGFVAFPISAPVLIESSAATNWRRFSQTFTVDSAAFSAAKCVLLTIQNTVSFVLTGVQLEPGPVATPFEHRPNELALCQRYYLTDPASGGRRHRAFARSDGATVKEATVEFPVTMRAVPTCNVSGGDAASFTGIAWATTQAFGAQFSAAVNQGRVFHTYTADAEL